MGRKTTNTAVTDTGGGQPRSKSRHKSCPEAVLLLLCPPCDRCTHKGSMRDAGRHRAQMDEKGGDGPPKSPCRDPQVSPRVVQGPPGPLAATPGVEMLKEPLWNPSLLCVFLLEKPGHIHAAVKTINTSSLTKSPILITPATANCKIGVESRCGFSPA